MKNFSLAPAMIVIIASCHVATLAIPRVVDVTNIFACLDASTLYSARFHHGGCDAAPASHWSAQRAAHANDLTVASESAKLKAYEDSSHHTVNRVKQSAKMAAFMTNFTDLARGFTLTEPPHAHKNTILEDIALAHANLDKRRIPTQDADRDSIVTESNQGAFSDFELALIREQIDVRGVLTMDHVDMTASTADTTVPTLSDAFMEQGNDMVHTFKQFPDAQPEDNAPNGFFGIGLTTMSLFISRLFFRNADINPTLHANPAANIKRDNTPGSIETPGPRQIAIIIPVCVGFAVAFLLGIVCFLQHNSEESSNREAQYCRERHDEVNRRAYEQNQRELERLRWHKEACAGVAHNECRSGDIAVNGADAAGPSSGFPSAPAHDRGRGSSTLYESPSPRRHNGAGSVGSSNVKDDSDTITLVDIELESPPRAFQQSRRLPSFNTKTIYPTLDDLDRHRDRYGRL